MPWHALAGRSASTARHASAACKQSHCLGHRLWVDGWTSQAGPGLHLETPVASGAHAPGCLYSRPESTEASGPARVELGLVPVPNANMRDSQVSREQPVMPLAWRDGPWASAMCMASGRAGVVQAMVMGCHIIESNNHSDLHFVPLLQAFACSDWVTLSGSVGKGRNWAAAPAHRAVLRIATARD